jgi:hypothetical protein
MEKRKFRRRQWHTRNRMAVFAHFKGVCQVCNVEISTKWDVHHLSYDYKKSVYAYDADELISNGIITLICRKCHNGVHTIGDVDDLATLTCSPTKISSISLYEVVSLAAKVSVKYGL